MDKKEAIKELKFERNISAGVMEQLGTTKALREIVAIQQKKRTQTYDTAIEALEKQIPIKMKDMRAVNDFLGRYYTCIGGTADAAAEILLMDKYRMFFVHAYSADGKTIGEIVTKSIYGDNVTPATNNTIISIHVGSWDSGTAIISYTQGRPSLSIK